MIKATISLPVLLHTHYDKPTIEDRLTTIVIRWNYQSKSWDCQGNWEYYECEYDKLDFNYNEAISDLTEFVKDHLNEKPLPLSCYNYKFFC